MYRKRTSRPIPSGLALGVIAMNQFEGRPMLPRLTLSSRKATDVPILDSGAVLAFKSGKSEVIDDHTAEARMHTMRPNSVSTVIATLTLATTSLAAGSTAASIAGRQAEHTPHPASPTATATGCVRAAEDAGTYVRCSGRSSRGDARSFVAPTKTLRVTVRAVLCCHPSEHHSHHHKPGRPRGVLRSCISLQLVQTRGTPLA